MWTLARSLSSRGLQILFQRDGMLPETALMKTNEESMVLNRTEDGPGLSKHVEQASLWGPVLVLWECGGSRAVVTRCLLTVAGLRSFPLFFLPSLLFSWLLNSPEVGSLLSPHCTCTAMVHWATPGLQLGYP